MAVTNIRITGTSIPANLREGLVVHKALVRESSQSGDSYNLRLKGDYQGFKEIQAIKLRLNELAERIRGLEKREDVLEELKSNLNQINKFFPPYPPGSEERVKFLKSFVAFRVLIDRLTTSPVTTNMTEEMASEKSISLRDAIARQGEGISTDKKALQYLLNNSSI